MIQVSVVTCCYNDGRFLTRALESLCHQTLPANQFELIFVNDGSPDETERVALSFSEKLNLRYFKHDTNRGLTTSCNLALQHARGEYFIRLDADDFFEPAILERMSGPLQSGASDLVYCDRFEFVEATAETRYVSLQEFTVFKLIAIGTMLRKNTVMELGGYRRVFWEEYDLYMRYLMNSNREPSYIPEALYTYRIRPGSMTADNERMNEGWKELKALWPAAQLAKFGPLPLNK